MYTNNVCESVFRELTKNLTKFTMISLTYAEAMVKVNATATLEKN